MFQESYPWIYSFFGKRSQQDTSDKVSYLHKSSYMWSNNSSHLRRKCFCIV